MSTSILYHGWGLKNYSHSRTEYRDGAMFFHVEKHQEKRVCPRCGGREFALAGKVSPAPTIRSLPIGRKPVFLVPQLHRIECFRCEAVVQEDRLFAAPKKHFSHQLEQYILDLCRSMTIEDVAVHLDMSWETVKDIVKADLGKRAAQIRWRGLRLIAIDEVSVRKGQDYLTVVLDLETGRVLYVTESRRAEALAPFFKKIRRSRTKLEAVAMDMSNSYKLALELYYRRPCSIVYDRFHVMKLLHFAIDQIRREEMRKAISDEARRFLKGQRFLLLRASENLEPEQLDALETLLKANGTLCTAYILKEQLRLLWDQTTKSDGERYLRAWIAKAAESGIKRLMKFAKTLQDHWEGLVSYFDHRISTGPLEGVNNSIKVLKRKAYGYRDVDFFKLRILFIHECGLKLTNA